VCYNILVFKKIFKIIIVLILLIIVLAVSGFILLNSSGFTQRVAPYFIHKHFKDVKINNLTIEKQNFNLPSQLKFENIKAQIIIKNDRYDLDTGSVVLSGSNLFSLTPKKYYVHIKDLNLSSELIKFKKAAIALESSGRSADANAINGNFFVSAVQYLDYRAKNISGNLRMDLVKLMMRNVQAQAYGGRLGGEIVLEYQQDLTYSIKVNIKQVELKKLEQANAALFSQVKGKVDGRVDIRGKLNGKNNISGTIWYVEGGEIKATLLKPLLEYIPQSAKIDKLNTLINENGYIPLDAALVRIESLQDKKFSAEIDFESKEYNLDVDLSLDFNIEGGLTNLIKLQKHYLLQKR